jgi:PAS domain S-box-containing protein
MTPHAENPIGKPIGEVWPSDEGFMAVNWYQAVYERGEVISRSHLTRVYPDGSAHHFSLHVQPVTWGSEGGVLIMALEITELIEANQVAQESKRILDALMQYIPEGITIADAPDVRIRQVSQFGRMLTGRPAEEIEGIPMEDHPEKWQIFDLQGKLVPPEQLPLSRATLKGEVVESEEYILRRPSGEDLIILCNAGPIRDEKGGITGGLIAWRDITDRKRVELGLKQRDELMQKLLDNIPVMIAMYRPDIKVATVNREFERIIGWTNEEVQHMDIMAVCYPDPEYRKKVSDFMASLTGWMDIEMTAKDGSRVATTWSNIRLEDDTHLGIGLDIRAQKQARQALIESEARFRSVLDHSIDAAYRRDLRSDSYDYMSPSIQQILGFTAYEMSTMSTQEVVERIHPDDRAAVEAAIERMNAEGKGKIVYRFKGKKGQYHWLADYSNILYADDGTPRYRAGIVRDVTESKQYEQALQESESRFRALADNIAQLAWMTDPNGWIYWYNQRWFDYTGTNLDEMQGWGWMKVHHPDHVERVVEKFRHHIQLGEPWEDTFPLLGKDGQYRWFLSRAQPIFDRDGQVMQWFGTNTDITAQREAEELLRQSEERFRIALDRSPIVVFTMDADLRYTWLYNTRDGFDVEQVLGQRDEDLLAPEEAAKLTAFKREVLAAKGLHRREIAYNVGDTQVVYDLSAEPLFDEQGQVCGLIAAAINVTGIRRMEREAMEQRTRIEVQRHLIAQREEERARIAREIHDGPVQSLSVLLFSLEELNWVAQQEERQMKIAEIAEGVQSEIKDLRNLCNELRPSTLHFFGLEKAIRSHIDTLTERYPGVDFKLNLSPDRLTIPADIRLEMYRILQEALNNCLKHANPNRVQIYLGREGSTVILEIADDGQGFILNPRQDEYAKRGNLGLIGMQERAEIIGGSLIIDTRPGKGTRIIVKVEIPPSVD